jgi:type IV secretory pathway VirB10-like protein
MHGVADVAWLGFSARNCSLISKVSKMEKFGHFMYNISISITGSSCSIEKSNSSKGFTGRKENIAGCNARRKRMKRLILILLLALSTGFYLSACGGQETQQEGTQQTEESQPAQQEQQQMQSEEPSAQEQQPAVGEESAEESTEAPSMEEQTEGSDEAAQMGEESAEGEMQAEQTEETEQQTQQE